MATSDVIPGEYVTDVRLETPHGEVRVSLWRNPVTGRYTALDTMELPGDQSFFYDAYDGRKVRVADTFTGLPK